MAKILATLWLVSRKFRIVFLEEMLNEVRCQLNLIYPFLFLGKPVLKIDDPLYLNTLGCRHFHRGGDEKCHVSYCNFENFL